jgi:hypothetical protein
MDEKRSVTVELAKYGGGFLSVELVRRRTIGPVKWKRWTTEGTDLCAIVSVDPKNFPSGATDVPCVAKWTVADDNYTGKDHPSVSGRGTISLAKKEAKIAFNIWKLGPWLHKGLKGRLSVHVDADFRDDPDKIDTTATPQLSVTFSWGSDKTKVTKNLSDLIQKAEALALGQVIEVNLDRSSWSMHVRLRVRHTGTDGKWVEEVIDFGTKSTKTTWTLGVTASGDLLPLALRAKQSSYSFQVSLQVSADDKTYINVFGDEVYGVLTAPVPALEGFSTSVGNAAQASMDAGSWTEAAGSSQDWAIRANVKFKGLADTYRPPFWVECWAYRALKDTAVMHPVGGCHSQVFPIWQETQTQGFEIEIVTDSNASSLKGWTPFGVLRATSAVSTALSPTVSYAGFEGFGDEDFAVGPLLLGVCSSEITKKLRSSLSREPWYGDVRYKLTAEATESGTTGYYVVFECSVLGLKSFWTNSKAKFVAYDTKTGTIKLPPLATTYVPGANRCSGTLRGRLLLSDLRALTGKDVTVCLDPNSSTSGSGGHATFMAMPSLGPMVLTPELVRSELVVDVTCPTTFFPPGWSLSIKVHAKGATSWIVIEQKALAQGDKTLMFTLKAANVGKELFANWAAKKTQLRIVIGRPDGYSESVGNNKDLIVEALDQTVDPPFLPLVH